MTGLDFSRYQTRRVRHALALDEIEEIARKCGFYAQGKVADAKHYANEMRFCIAPYVRDIAAEYDLGYADLMADALAMLHEELHKTFHGLRCQVQYIKPYIEDGDCAGMSARFYIDLWEEGE